MVAVVAAVIGISIGYGLSVIFNPQPSSLEAPAQSSLTTTPNTETKPAIFKSTVTAIGSEHASLLAQTLIASYDGRTDYTTLANQLDLNSKDFQKIMSDHYSPDVAKRFYDSWNSQVGFLTNYATALKKGDSAGADKAKQDLTGFTENLADLLAQQNPNIDKSGMKQLLNDHVTLMKAVVDAYAGKDMALSYAKQHEAVTQMAKITGTLAAAIVKQNPSKF